MSIGRSSSLFGMHGSSPGKVAYPCELAVDGEGNIPIADCWHIQKFTSEGQFSFLVLLALHSVPVTIRCMCGRY